MVAANDSNKNYVIKTEKKPNQNRKHLASNTKHIFNYNNNWFLNVICNKQVLLDNGIIKNCSSPPIAYPG